MLSSLLDLGCQREGIYPEEVMMKPVPIVVTVNGRQQSGNVECRRLLSDFLREDLGLKGVKISCDIGVCGACTVLMGGRTVRSCLVLAVQADGEEIRTVESLAV